MNRSDSIKELAAALAKAQAAIRGAVKDSTNPHFKSKYADLSAVWDACRDALTSNGLAVAQGARAAEGGVEVETMLMHSSGEWISESLAVPVSKADAQGFGSALTYCRRYALAAMVGVAPEDDDGNAAAQAKPTETFRPAQTSSKVAAAAGVIEKLPVAEQKQLRSYASTLTDMVIAGDVETAYLRYTEYKADLDADQQVALRGELPSNVRTALQKEAERVKQNSLRAMQDQFAPKVLQP